MKFFLSLLVMGLFSIATHAAHGQAWTHSIPSPAGTLPANVDVSFNGSGPNWAAWKGTFVEVHAFQTGERLIHVEQDVGTCNGGGVYTGEYKRSEAWGLTNGNWKKNQKHRSILSPALNLFVEVFFL
jgi:hypothetical protein